MKELMATEAKLIIIKFQLGDTPTFSKPLLPNHPVHRGAKAQTRFRHSDLSCSAISVNSKFYPLLSSLVCPYPSFFNFVLKYSILMQHLGASCSVFGTIIFISSLCIQYKHFYLLCVFFTRIPISSLL